MEKINLRRIRQMFAQVVILMVLLLGRTFYIQILCHENLTEGAVSQYEISVQGLDTRGAILDRNYMPLTGGKSQYYYFIKKNREDEFLSSYVSYLEAKQIAREDASYYVFRCEKYNADINTVLKEKYRAYVFESSARYADDQVACHLIGYINQDEKVGVSGLELMYEDVLEAENSKLTLWADGAGNIFAGKEPAVSNRSETGSSQMNGNVLVTSIDRRIQSVTEKALAQKIDKGAALVMDVETGEILAWASMPTFNPNDLASYLSAEDDHLLNKVSQGAYAPGSVFKIVTAAAALENGLDEDTRYECLGKVEIEGVNLSCSTAPEGGHGIIDMNTAMAESCNCYFAQLGKTIGYEKIIKMAEKFGFGKLVLEDYFEENSGNLPSVDSLFLSDISNISIGQGKILATPIQVAKMTAVIAKKGEDIRPKAVISKQNIYKENQQVLSAQNAEKIEAMMGLVMTEGTARNDWKIPVYGKTGTAEAGSKKHCWFTGFCDVGDKRYVITVMAEDGDSGSATSAPVFKEIVDYLIKTQE